MKFFSSTLGSSNVFTNIIYFISYPYLVSHWLAETSAKESTIGKYYLVNAITLII